MLIALLAILPHVGPVRDSLPPLDTAKVQAVRWQFAAQDGFERTIVSNGASGNLSRELARSGIYVKQYGPNGTATLSVRGADPQQTQVLWNGIPISNPMHGMTDLNAISLSSNQEISIINSNAASFYGSGNVGGALLLSHQAPDSNSISALFTANSWKSYTAHLDLGFRKKGFYIRNQGQHTFGTNQYTYRNPQQGLEKGPLIKEKNASNQSITERLLMGHDGKTWDVKAIGEFNAVYRALGSRLNTEITAGEQWDQNVRLLAEARYHKRNFAWNSRTAWVQDQIHFRDTNTHEDETTRARTLHVQTEIHGVFRAFSWITGADLQHIEAAAPAYGGTKVRTYPAQIAAIRWQKRFWFASASSRFEWFEKLPVFSGSFGHFLGPWKTELSLRSSYRRPTLNDQFWSRNSPIALKPERGTEVEFDFGRKYIGKIWNYRVNTAFFARQLSEAIVWIPNGLNWEAVNYFSAQYAGLQLNSEAGRTVRSSAVSAQVNIQILKSAVKTASTAEAYQRIFIPNTNGGATLTWKAKRWMVQTDVQHTGKRFVTTDNSATLPGYTLWNAALGCDLHSIRMNGTFTITATNILGAAYYVMPGKPMPFRGYVLTYSCKFKP